MEQGIRKILKENYHEIMNTITEPYLVAGFIHVFTPVDLERIESEARERGPSTGVFELLNRLQKRGPHAFPQLIEALRKKNHGDLANKLENRAVACNLYRPIRQADSPPVARGPWPSSSSTQAERPLSTPVQPASRLNHQASTEESMHASQSFPVLLPNIKIPVPEALTPLEQAKPQQPKKGKETLLKDIPSNLKDKVVGLLGIENALGYDWKGVAGELQITAEQQGQIKACPRDPMEELFNQMLHKGYRVINLVNILKKIERYDVITEISSAGFYSEDQEGDGDIIQSPTQAADDPAANKFDEGLPLPRKVSENSMIEERRRDAVIPATNPVSPTEEELKTEAVIQAENLLSPTEEEKKPDAINPASSPFSPTRSEFHYDSPTVKEKMMDEKKEDNTPSLPSPTEVSVFGSDDSTKQKTNMKKESTAEGRTSESEDARLDSDKEVGANGVSKSLPSPTQVSEFDSLTDTTTKSEKKKEAHLSQEVEDAKKEEEEAREPLTDMTHFEEVFLPDIQTKAFFITCEKYQKLGKIHQLNRHINKLSRELEDGNWEHIPLKDYTSAKMKSELELKLLNLSQSDVCFVYLAGHTLQINGENYFLPIDVELDFAAADIIDSCLNINSLVKQLSEKALMAIVVVDGGHFTDEKFKCPFALPGLASMIPPSKTVIAFPCQPGYIRPQEEALLYLKALINVINEKKDIALTELFDSVREELEDSQSLPVEFSLSPSFLPMSLNTSEEVEEGVTIRKADDDTPRHAVIFDAGLHEVEMKVKPAEHLKASLEQLGWQVEMFFDLKPQEIKEKIRQSLKVLQDMNVFMVYLNGYVPKDEHSIGQYWDHDAHAQKLPIHWLVNIMSEYVTGPKALVVDHPSVHVLHKLRPMTSVPQEVLCCLPNGERERSREGRKPKNSFTLLFAQNLGTSRHYSLDNVIRNTGQKLKSHHVVSKLFYA